MSRFITENLIPIKVHVKENPQGFKRFGAQWTPTQLILDPDGAEKYKMEGFYPADDFLAQLKLGVAKIDFQAERYAEAEKAFRKIYDELPQSGAAPEALYWAGVAAYKATNDPQHLKETAIRMQQKYPGTEWFKKASVWL